MPNAFWSTAANIGQQVGSAGMGLLLGKQQDKRQLNMSRKLQRMEMEGNKEMTDYNYNKQLQMWQDTGYGAQMKQLKEAGLNPGLIYGMGGAGGGTTNIETGNTNTGHSTGQGELQAMMGMGLQTSMLQAQKELIQAQTKKVEAETPNEPLKGQNIITDTKLKEADIQLKGQQQRNLEKDGELKDIEIKMQSIAEHIAGMTQNDQVAQIKQLTAQGAERIKQMIRENKIGAATEDTAIAQIKADLGITYLEGWLKHAQTKNLNQSTIESVQRTKNLFHQMWRSMREMGDDAIRLNNDIQQTIDTDGDFPEELKNLMPAFLIPLGGMKGKPTEVRGLHKRN